jgi:hypothetical protein
MIYWNQPVEPVNWAKPLRAKRPVGSQQARVDKARVSLQKWMVRVAGRRRRNKKWLFVEKFLQTLQDLLKNM